MQALLQATFRAILALLFWLIWLICGFSYLKSEESVKFGAGSHCTLLHLSHHIQWTLQMLFQTTWSREPSRRGGLKADDEDGDEEEAKACTIKMSLSWHNNGV